MNEKHDYILRIRNRYVTDCRIDFSDNTVWSYTASNRGTPFVLYGYVPDQVMEIARSIDKDCFAVQIDIDQPGTHISLSGAGTCD